MNEVQVPPSPFAPFDPPPPPPSTAVPVAFSGNRREFLSLIVKGAALGLVTFGFYRFWLSTYVRRHLWSGTSVDGDAPEYTGTPIELLLGFLFAIAILVPVYIAYFLVGVLAETYYTFASFPLAVFLFVFAQFAIYRARRYRLTRTVWRGVRFWMRGSGWNYALRSVLWLLFALVTFGAALAWRVAALERFKMRHSFYGNLQGRFDGTGLELFKRVWIFWLIVLGVISAITVLMYKLLPAFVVFGGPEAAGVVVLVAFFVMLLVWLAIYPFYKAIEWHWWVSGLRFGDVSFQSSLSKSGLLGLYWKVVGWSVLFFVLMVAGMVGVTALGGGVTTVGNARIGSTFAGFWPVAVIIVLYIVTLLAIGVVMQLYLTRDLWQRVAETTVVHNLAAAAEVIAQGDAANALGEGFADGLDVGGL